MYKKKWCKTIALAMSVFMAAGCMSPVALAEDSTEIVTEAPAPQPETQAPQPETQAPQTEAPAPQPETQAPQTEAPAPQPETQAPQTEAPQTEAPAPQTEAQTPQTEASAPQTETSLTDSSKMEEETSSDSENSDSRETESEQKGTEKKKEDTSKAEVVNQTEAPIVQADTFFIDTSAYPPANVSQNTIEIYQFLRTRMGLNHAAACGVLANIQLESNFNPLAIGDGGTSYGLCQWHNGRRSNLFNYCSSKGLDSNTVSGQLEFLYSELQSHYPGVLSYIKNVPDTEQGAYDAAHYWCVHFEIPSNTYERAAQRGNLAKNEYFVRDFNKADKNEDKLDLRIKAISDTILDEEADKQDVKKEKESTVKMDESSFEKEADSIFKNSADKEKESEIESKKTLERRRHGVDNKASLEDKENNYEVIAGENFSSVELKAPDFHINALLF